MSSLCDSSIDARRQAGVFAAEPRSALLWVVAPREHGAHAEAGIRPSVQHWGLGASLQKGPWSVQEDGTPAGQESPGQTGGGAGTPGV